MNIKDIVLKVGFATVPASWLDVDNPLACLTSNFERLTNFAEALVAELAKENEPVYYLWENKYGDPQQMLSSNSGPHPEYVITALYTLPPTAEQVEQETAEAIAAYFGQQPHVEHFGDNIAEAIRSGAWKEFKK